MEKERVREEKTAKKNNWCKRAGDEIVIFVLATPGSHLQRKYQQEAKQQGFKIKVVKKVAVHSNPARVKGRTVWFVRWIGEDCVIDMVRRTKLNPPWQVPIPEEQNTCSHLKIRKSNRPYGNIAGKSANKKFRNSR